MCEGQAGQLVLEAVATACYAEGACNTMHILFMHAAAVPWLNINDDVDISTSNADAFTAQVAYRSSTWACIHELQLHVQNASLDAANQQPHTRMLGNRQAHTRTPL